MVKWSAHLPWVLPCLRDGLLILHVVPEAPVSSLPHPWGLNSPFFCAFASLSFLELMQGVTGQLCSCVWLSLQRAVIWKALRLEGVSMVVNGALQPHTKHKFFFPVPWECQGRLNVFRGS